MIRLKFKSIMSNNFPEIISKIQNHIIDTTKTTNKNKLSLILKITAT